MLRELLELYYYHSKWTERFALHDVKNVFEKTMRDLATFGFAEIRGKKILDLGCGQRYAFALQCAPAGAEVTALDIDYIKPHSLPLAFVRTIQHNGIKRALKTFFRRVLFDKRYYDILESITRNDLGTFLPRINFIISDPISGHYPLPADSFDLIFSNAVVDT